MDLNIPAGVPDLNQAIAEEKEDGPDDVHDGGHDRVVHPLDLNFVAAEEEEFIPGKILIAVLLLNCTWFLLMSNLTHTQNN